MPVRKKNHLYRSFVKSKNLKIEEKYKRYKNKLTAILRFSEKQYYTQLLSKYRDNVKKTWCVLNDVIKKKNNISTLPREFVSDNKIIKGKTEIANGFNDFFVNVGPKLTKNIPVHNDINVTNYMVDRNDKTMFFKSCK